MTILNKKLQNFRISSINFLFWPDLARKSGQSRACNSFLARARRTTLNQVLEIARNVKISLRDQAQIDYWKDKVKGFETIITERKSQLSDVKKQVSIAFRSGEQQIDASLRDVEARLESTGKSCCDFLFDLNERI